MLFLIFESLKEIPNRKITDINTDKLTKTKKVNK